MQENQPRALIYQRGIDDGKYTLIDSPAHRKKNHVKEVVPSNRPSIHKRILLHTHNSIISYREKEPAILLMMTLTAPAPPE
jgi:hypothetical protein